MSALQLSLPFNLVVQDWEVSMSANCCQKLLSIANFMSFQHISAVTKIWKIYMSAMNCWQKPLPVTNCHPILAVVTGEVSMSPNYSQKVLPIGFEPWDPIPCGRKRRAPSASDAPGGPGLGLGKMPENDSQCRPWPHRPWHNLRYIPTTFSSIVARFRNQHRQGTPSCVGGRKTMYQIQTKVTMEQKQVNQALLQLQQQNLL